MSSRRDDPSPSPSPSPIGRRSPRRGQSPSGRRSPNPGQSPSPRRGQSPTPRRGRSRSPSQSRGNIGNVKRISEMFDIYGVKSLYKVIVDREADYGGGYYKYQLDDGMVVDIKEVNLIRRDHEVGVDTLIRILECDLGPQTNAGMSAPVCIYYVKDAKSPTGAKEMMDKYSKLYPGYATTEDPFEIRKHIYNLKHLQHLQHSKHLKLKTNSGGGRHRRRSRRGKGKGKKSRSSKTLRRGRR
jgi:hypothetical protein